MRSPIKENINNFCSSKILKEIIPKGTVVNSFLFFSGVQEFSLAESERLVIAHTNKYVIYEFWKCVIEDPQRIAKIAEYMFSKMVGNWDFHLLQENWPKYKDPYIRSALFFLLNRCSESGFISTGKLNDERYNPISLSYLNNFNVRNFHIIWDKKENVHETFIDIENTDYLLFPVGKFNYNLFEYGKNKGYEMTTIHHKKLYESLQEIKHKWVTLYKYHPQANALYKDYNITMIDKYGRETKDKDNCEELVIANF